MYNNIIESFIVSHGILDIYNSLIYKISYLDYICYYLLGVIVLEYIIKKTIDIYIFIFILLSALHFSNDFNYLLGYNIENLYLGLSIITFNLLNENTKNIYYKFFNILNLNNYFELYKYLKIINYLLLLRFFVCELKYNCIYILIALSNYCLDPIINIKIYFLCIHIPINIYRNYQDYNSLLYLFLFNIIIYNMKNFNKITYSMIVTGLSISSIHIIDNFCIKYYR